MGFFLGRVVLTIVLLTIAAKDWSTQRIPVWWLWLLMPVFLIWSHFVEVGSFVEHVLGGIVYGGFFLVLYLVSRKQWFGSGDVWLAMFLGVMLGWRHALVSMYLVCVLSLVVAVGDVMTRKSQKRADVRLAFAPILIASAMSTLWFGAALMKVVQHWVG